MKKRKGLGWVLVMVPLFIIAGVLIITLTAAPNDAFWPVHSTYYTDEFGTHGLERIVRTLDWDSKKNYYPLDEVEDFGFNNYILLGPRSYLNSDDRTAFYENIREGSWAICSPRRTNNFLEDIGIELNRSDFEDEYLRGEIKVHPTLPDALFEDLKDLKYYRKENPGEYADEKMNSDYAYHFASDSLPIMPLLEANGEIHLGYINLGEGRIFLLSNPYIFLNEGLKKRDNGRFALGLLQSIQEQHPGTFIFEEYSHGFSLDKVATPLNVPEVRWTIWAMIALFLLMVWSLSRPKGKPVPIYREPRRSISEYVDSMAHLYEKNDLTDDLAHDIAKDFLVRVRKALGFGRVKDLKKLKMVWNRANQKWGKESADDLKWILNHLFQPKDVQRVSPVSVVARIRKFCIKQRLD